ncbi:hypothetical protein BC629DRAFT_866223 [Irpex lacteus]|nr:hypothetical protein BC629DRAFT_866223 [Irpex lacteus]
MHMATAADLPPELFRRILLDVCEGAEQPLVLDLNQELTNRKEAVMAVSACSLTCLYWARICREQLFREVRIKSYKDVRAFSWLVSNTPKRLTPISKYVRWVTLVQRVGERPWIHLLWLQPSLCLLRGGVNIHFEINNEDSDTPRDATTPQRSTSRRLFAGLPRTPPSSCYQCNTLMINRPHFVTLQDFTSLLRKFVWDQSLWLISAT